MKEHADWGTLLGWWTGGLDEALVDGVEEHLFACADCTRRAELLAALEETLRQLEPAAFATGAVTPALVDGLVAAGVPLQRFRVARGGVTPCAVAVGSALLITELELPDDDADSLDLLVYDAGGSVVHRVADVPFSRDAGVAVVSAPAGMFLDTPAGARFGFALARAAGEHDGEHEGETLAHYTLEHEGVLRE